MVLENSIDYFVVQARIQSGLLIQDELVHPFKNISTGSSFKKSNKRQSGFYSTNSKIS